jgi:hypothetical protein
MADDSEVRFRTISTPGTPTLQIIGPTIASAVTFVSGGYYMQAVSGVAAMTLMALPYDGFSGSLKFRPTGIFTWATGGAATAVNKPFGLAGTAVVGKVLEFVYDIYSGLWYPSYIA